MFLDADDTLAPQAASRAAAAFAADPAAARLQFRITAVDESGHELTRAPGRLHPFEPAATSGSPSSPHRSRCPRCHVGQCLPHRAAPADHADSREPLRRLGADYYLVHLSTLLGPVIFLPETGAHYRVHGTNAFQPSASVLNLQRIRSEIRYQEVTLECLSKLASACTRSSRPILSMSNLILRIVSRRLAPEDHPVPGTSFPLCWPPPYEPPSAAGSDSDPALRSGGGARLALYQPTERGEEAGRADVFPELRGRRGKLDLPGWRVSAPSRGRSV